MQNKMDDKTLVQFWLNANVTNANCGGHGKALQNEKFIKEYEREMIGRGMSIPSEKYKGGIFNGNGSY